MRSAGLEREIFERGGGARSLPRYCQPWNRWGGSGETPYDVAVGDFRDEKSSHSTPKRWDDRKFRALGRGL